jgi:hypothetical protein
MAKTSERPERLAAFARWLQQRLNERDLLPSGLAKLSGLHASTIGGWLHCENEPYPNNVRDAAVALGVDPEDAFRVIGWLPARKLEFTEAEKSLVLRARRLPADRRRLLEGQLDLLLGEQEMPKPSPDSRA